MAGGGRWLFDEGLEKNNPVFQGVSILSAPGGETCAIKKEEQLVNALGDA